MRRMSFMNDARSSSGMEEGSAVAADQLPAAADPQALSHRDKRLIAISMMLPVFLGSVDQSVLASALPTIGRDLGQVHNLPWLITAFLIASTALTPLYGKFADIHGRPRHSDVGSLSGVWRPEARMAANLRQATSAELRRIYV